MRSSEYQFLVFRSEVTKAVYSWDKRSNTNGIIVIREAPNRPLGKIFNGIEHYILLDAIESRYKGFSIGNAEYIILARF